jgi:HAD superfamily hydrolase (TIGR01549 family)
VVTISIPTNVKVQSGYEEKLEFNAQLFVFDKDGTLLTHDHFIPIMQKRVELFSKIFQLSSDDEMTLSRVLGLDPETNDIIPNGTMYIARADTQLLVEAFLMECGFTSSEVRNQVQAVFEQADSEVQLENYIKPLPGISELLAGLKKHGAKIVIATHDSTSAAKRQLSVAGLDQYLDLIIGLDFAPQVIHKPSPSMLHLACEKLNSTPDSAVVIGDSVNDVLMGKRGGAGMSIAVLSGEHKTEDFKEYDVIIESVAELKIKE